MNIVTAYKILNCKTNKQLAKVHNDLGLEIFLPPGCYPKGGRLTLHYKNQVAEPGQSSITHLSLPVELLQPAHRIRSE